jgi:CheY-like chemotaxis protein
MPIMDGLEAVVLIDNHIRTNSGKKTFVYALTADCNPKIQNLIK